MLSEKTKETEIRVKDVNENEFYTYLEIPSKKPTDPSKPNLGSLRKYWSSSYGSKLKLNSSMESVKQLSSSFITTD